MYKVQKRNGKLVPFSIAYIQKAIQKAFLSANVSVKDDVIADIASNVHIWDKINVEDIQDQVEELLMDWNYPQVAKAYILYRNHKNELRNWVKLKEEFIENYKKSSNTANATIDDNANVNNHNIAVLNSEIHKEDNQQVNYAILRDYVQKLYPDFDAKQLDIDLNTIAYLHDSSSQIGMPYCVAITMYPFLLNGLKDLGGLSAAPKNIDSFCGLFVNLIFAIAGQFKGAVAAPGFLLCMDWFLRKEWGEDYYINKDSIINSSICKRQNTIQHQIHQYFQQICYSLMQPSGARGSQACFWNCSIFDKPFFDTMYGDFYFPDGSQPNWNSLNWLQKDFVHWLNQERLKCILTFPVVSVCLIYQDNDFLDYELADFVADEYSQGNSFFTYISDSADSLSSCCRLSSKISKPQFNFTNGQLSEMTGSKNVITLDFNRIVQDCFRTLPNYEDFIVDGKVSWSEEFYDKFYEYKFKPYIIDILDRIYKYHTAYNTCLLDLQKAKLLSVYDAGFIDMKKQYLTIGINGLNQCAEYLGIECNKNEKYEKLCNVVFTTIKEQNMLHKTSDIMFNTEFTPCESAAIKLYNRDKRDGYWIPKDTNLYASYIFKPNDPNISVLDKLYLHGNAYCGDNLDGGSSAHINLDSHLSKPQYQKLLEYAAQVGCKYFTFNVPNCECEDCGYIAKQPFNECPKCGSKNVSLWDRIIG